MYLRFHYWGNFRLGKTGFHFDIRIQLGAGSYVCGEETSLISSCEGKRGDPKNRPPFPAQKGYLGFPTCVSNVETFSCVVSILDRGAGWFAESGSKGCTGTKLLSVSGDCHGPGVYEVKFGIPVRELLELVGAENTKAVQVGGPSGQMIGKEKFDRLICYDDLATGGSIMIFGAKRNILEIVHSFMKFFSEESCGYCTPCRVGNVIIMKYLEKIMDGNGEPADIQSLIELCETVKTASRCGLGQTSPNPVLTTLENFSTEYETLVHENKDGFQKSFDINKVLETSEKLTGRQSTQFHLYKDMK